MDVRAWLSVFRRTYEVRVYQGYPDGRMGAEKEQYRSRFHTRRGARIHAERLATVTGLPGAPLYHVVTERVL